MADNSAAMGGHNLGCGDDDEEEGRLPDDNFYDNKVAKGKPNILTINTLVY